MGGGGGGGTIPRAFTHNFCCYSNRSVCLYLFRATASSGVSQAGNFHSSALGTGDKQRGRFLPQKLCGG